MRVYNSKNRPSIRKVTPVRSKSSRQSMTSSKILAVTPSAKSVVPKPKPSHLRGITPRSRIVNSPKNKRSVRSTLTRGYPWPNKPAIDYACRTENGGNFGICRDQRLCSITSTRDLRLPYLKSNDLPPPLVPPIGGGLAYDIITKTVYYSDGKTWLPLLGGGSGVALESYGLGKSAPQTITTATPTIVDNYDDDSSLGYHTLTGWDLTTGIYTAATNEILSVGVNISWEANISNLGTRTIRIIRVDTSAATTAVVAESVTQADADITVETTQELYIHVTLDAGDQVFVEVEHNAPVSLELRADAHTTISGFKGEL